MTVNKMAARTSDAASMMLLALMLLASLVSAKQHHSSAHRTDWGTKKALGDGPAWKARRNNWTKGTDLLD